MNSSPSLRRLVRHGKFRSKPPTRGIPFKVFIGYADLAAARDATATIADAIRSSGRKFEIHPWLWRFDQLASAHWSERAVRAACDADIVVLASSDPASISDGIEGWVASLLKANRGQPTTIVAIAGPADAWTISIEEAGGTFTPHRERASEAPLEVAEIRT